jgi:hypothetical protein
MAKIIEDASNWPVIDGDFARDLLAGNNQQTEILASHGLYKVGFYWISNHWKVTQLSPVRFCQSKVEVMTFRWLYKCAQRFWWKEIDV